MIWMFFNGFFEINFLISIPSKRHGDAQTRDLANIEFFLPRTSNTSN